ncbi:MAG: NAD(P)H-binding protein [Thaumarchaeota archaeon]|nr:NAD(P)H-binding protein [Nitrososphaerota archaeon]MDE1866212.1 NAD(P)H-binding protein [Nitrososphaerota archaeon]
MNKLVITGANGFVGRNVGKFLARNGFDITALIRKNRKKAVDFGRSVISKDLTENNLAKSVKGSDALLHFIGKGRQTADSHYDTVNVVLTRNAIALCKKSGIKKIIYLSGLGVDKKSTLGYFISKFKAEQEIIQSGLDYTIFRPSYIMGKGDPLSKVLLGQIRKDCITIPGSGKYRLQPILVSDVAQVVMKAIRGKQFSKKTIDLVGPKTVTYNRFVRDLVGSKTKIKHIEFEKAYHDAIRSSESEFGVDDLSVLVGDYVGNHKKLGIVSGVKFAKYNEMLEACSLS